MNSVTALTDIPPSIKLFACRAQAGLIHLAGSSDDRKQHYATTVPGEGIKLGTQWMAHRGELVPYQTTPLTLTTPKPQQRRVKIMSLRKLFY